MKNKICSVIIILILGIGSLNSTSVYGKTDNDSEIRDITIKRLLDVGASEYDIEQFTENDLRNFDNCDTIDLDIKYYVVPNDITKKPRLVSKEKVDYELLKKNSRVSDTETSNDGYIKQYLYLAKATGYNDKYYISYSAEWLIQPWNRKIDVFGVAVGNATVVPNTVTASYYWVIDRYYNGKYQPNWSSDRVDLSGNLTTFSGGAAAKCDLMSDTIDGVQKVVTQKMDMSFYATIDYNDVNNVSASGHYLHQEKVITISPSITAISLSVGISVSSSSDFALFTPNPYVVAYR